MPFGNEVKGFFDGLQGGMAMQNQLSSMRSRQYQDRLTGAQAEQQEAETTEYTNPENRAARLKTLQGNADLSLAQARGAGLQADQAEAELREFQDPDVMRVRRGRGEADLANAQATADNNRSIATQNKLAAQKAQVDLIEYTTPAAAQRREETEQLLQQQRYDEAAVSAAAVDKIYKDNWAYRRDYAQTHIAELESAGKEVPDKYRVIAESDPPEYLNDVHDRIQGAGGAVTTPGAPAQAVPASPGPGVSAAAPRATVGGMQQPNLQAVMQYGQEAATVRDPFTGKDTPLPQMSPVQSAVWAGNVKQESSGNPRAFNEKEGAYGSIQWRLNRRDNLEAFAKANGMPVDSLRTQTLFGRWEMANTERGAGQNFLGAQTPEAANAALKGFIRYGDNSQATRLANGQQLMGMAANASGDTSGVGGAAAPAAAPAGAAAPAQRAPYQAVPVQQAPVPVQNSFDQDREEMNQTGARAHAEIMTPAGAVPTAEDEARIRGHFRGDGAPDPEAWQQLTEMTSGMDPADLPYDQQQLLQSLAVYRNTKRNYPQDLEKQKAVASELLQRARLEADKWTAISKAKAQRGDVKGTLHGLLRAAAHVPNGVEADYQEQDDGDYEISFKRRNGEVVHKVVAPPNQILSFALGVGPKDAYQALYSLTGTTPPGGSPAYQEAQQNILSTSTPAGMQVPDISGMTAEEGEKTRAAYAPLQVKPGSPEELNTLATDVTAAWNAKAGDSMLGQAAPLLTGLSDANRTMIANNAALIQNTAVNLAHSNAMPADQAMGIVLSMMSVSPTNPEEQQYKPVAMDADGSVRLQDTVNGTMIKMPGGDYQQLMRQRQEVEGSTAEDLAIEARGRGATGHW